MSWGVRCQGHGGKTEEAPPRHGGASTPAREPLHDRERHPKRADTPRRHGGPVVPHGLARPHTAAVGACDVARQDRTAARATRQPGDARGGAAGLPLSRPDGVRTGSRRMGCPPRCPPDARPRVRTCAGQSRGAVGQDATRLKRPPHPAQGGASRGGGARSRPPTPCAAPPCHPKRRARPVLRDAARQGEGSPGRRSVASPAPNKRLQATASSLRSFLAAASSGA